MVSPLRPEPSSLTHDSCPYRAELSHPLSWGPASTWVIAVIRSLWETDFLISLYTVVPAPPVPHLRAFAFLI